MGCSVPYAIYFGKRSYLLFLKCLLKDQPYVEFAYMTGVLPIAKYSSGSELNMFVEPEEAITQIKNKNYALRFKGKFGEKSQYTGRILAVGISYSKKTKEHDCKIERLEQ